MKRIFILTIASILMLSLLLLSGCVKPQNDILSDRQKIIDQLKRDFGFNGETIEFTADTFAQAGPLSFMYSIDVKVVGTDIYMDNTLYDSIEYISNPKITYLQTPFSSADESINDYKKVAEIMKKIKNCEGCYWLETQSDEVTSKQIAIYKIDGDYYFLSFFEETGEVARIHYANLE